MTKVSEYKFMYKINGTNIVFTEFADDEKELLQKINRRYSKSSSYTLDDIEIIEKSMLF
ncbi:MAG: hypothetical protein RR500_10250 [Bacilli bacterium]